ALHEEETVVRRDLEELLEERLRLLVDARVRLPAVAVLEDAHARALEGEEFLAGGLEGGEGEGRGSGAEVDRAGHGGAEPSRGPEDLHANFGEKMRKTQGCAAPSVWWVRGGSNPWPPHCECRGGGTKMKKPRGLRGFSWEFFGLVVDYQRKLNADPLPCGIQRLDS